MDLKEIFENLYESDKKVLKTAIDNDKKMLEIVNDLIIEQASMFIAILCNKGVVKFEELEKYRKLVKSIMVESNMVEDLLKEDKEV